MESVEASGRAARKRKQRRGQPGEPPMGRQDLADIVLLLRAENALTRQEIEQRSGLGRAAVVDRLVTLGKLGLAAEGELAQPSGGRAPRLIRFNRLAGVVVVGVMGQATLGMAVADLTGALVFEHHEAAEPGQPVEKRVERLCDLFDWALDQLQFPPEAVWSVGLSLPGPVVATSENLGNESLKNSPLQPRVASWRGVPVAGLLMQRYNAPVQLFSRIQAMTLGELREGEGRGVNDLLVLDVGQEITAGFATDGWLHVGAEGAAGLIGHTRVSDNGKTCHCGNSGCLVTLIGSDAIAEEGMNAVESGRSAMLENLFRQQGRLTAADVLMAAQQGDPFSAKLLAHCGRLLGDSVASVVNLLNPSLVILTGKTAQSGDALLASFREAVYRQAHPLTTRNLRIMRSPMSSSGSLAGAAHALVDEIFDPSFLPAWAGFGTPLLHQDVSAVLGQYRDQGDRSRVETPRVEISVAENHKT